MEVCDAVDVGEAIRHTVGRINANAPIIAMSLAINGNMGTLLLIAELLQLGSPLKSETMATCAQVSMGSHVENKEGPPGTGKSHVKALTCLR